MSRRTRSIVATLLLGLCAGAAAQSPQAPATYSVVSREGRRPLATRTINGQEMFAVEELARIFALQVREDPIAGGLTITVRGQSIVLSPGQDIVSVGGRLVSLPTPPAREGRAWFVPVDFVSRALAPVAGTRIEVRKPSRLILHGDIRFPRITGRVEPAGGMVRLILDVAPATPSTVAQEGARLLLRFDADALDLALPPSPPSDIVQAIRPEGATAVAVELGPRFATFRTTEQPAGSGGSRMILELNAKTTDAPPPGTPPPPPPPDPPLLDLVPAGGIRTVVIDPGHGGAEDGARGRNGTLEKNVTLSIARRLDAALEARLGVRGLLTRDGDQSIGLDERAAVANNNKADLFISLHANASVREAAAGVEVFYLSLQEYGEEALRTAEARRETLPVFGGGSRDIEVVQWRFAQARHIEESGAFARRLEQALRSRVAMSPRALQQAPLRVLVGANMPAVLVEVGFMTNPAQEAQLTSDAYQNEVVQAIVDALVQYRDAQAAPAAPRPATPRAAEDSRAQKPGGGDL